MVDPARGNLAREEAEKTMSDEQCYWEDDSEHDDDLQSIVIPIAGWLPRNVRSGRRKSASGSAGVIAKTLRCRVRLRNVRPVAAQLRGGSG
jgi:hypothetical protein